MKAIDEYFVPWVKGTPMYISNHIELAWQKPELHRMMSNENPNPPSQKVVDAITKYGKMANRYPDQGNVVRDFIAKLNGLDGPENVMLGNGSSEVFDNIFRSFLEPGDEVIQHTPCFGIYKLRCNILGGKLVSTPMKYENKKLLFDADSIINAVTPKTKMIVVPCPQNPTGNFMDKKDFIRIVELGIPTISDEAYIEYAGIAAKSNVDLVKKYPNLLVSRTMSKAYGLAGLRFGYALGNKDVIGQISGAMLPWNVGIIPMWAGLAGFEDQAALQQRVKFNNEQIVCIEEALKDVKGLDIFHSEGNYILFDATDAGKAGKDMVDYAMSKGLIFRGQNVMYGRDGWFRITIGSAEENQMAIKIIREFVTK
jgi:histidinol-phosphate aminotransferase